MKRISHNEGGEVGDGGHNSSDHRPAKLAAMYRVGLMNDGSNTVGFHDSPYLVQRQKGSKRQFHRLPYKDNEY